MGYNLSSKRLEVLLELKEKNVQNINDLFVKVMTVCAMDDFKNHLFILQRAKLLVYNEKNETLILTKKGLDLLEKIVD